MANYESNTLASRACEVVGFVPPEEVLSINQRGDYMSVIDRLREIEDGAALKLSFAPGAPEAGVLQGIRMSALRYGIKVSVRHIGDIILLIRKATVAPNLPPFRQNISDRNKEIVARLHQGEKYESIAASFDLTKQRIEQISIANNLLGRNGYKMMRAKDAEAALAPYFEKCHAKNLCLICRESTGSDRNLDLCGACRRTVQIIRTIKARLAAFLKGGDARHRNTAFYLIRKHGVKPEDLERY